MRQHGRGRYPRRYPLRSHGIAGRLVGLAALRVMAAGVGLGGRGTPWGMWRSPPLLPCPLPWVERTVAGRPPRSSAQLRISSWSVVIFAPAIALVLLYLPERVNGTAARRV